MINWPCLIRICRMRSWLSRLLPLPFVFFVRVNPVRGFESSATLVILVRRSTSNNRLFFFSLPFFQSRFGPMCSLVHAEMFTSRQMGQIWTRFCTEKRWTHSSGSLGRQGDRDRAEEVHESLTCAATWNWTRFIWLILRYSYMRSWYLWVGKRKVCDDES